MAKEQIVTGELATAKRIVELLEEEGFPLDTAVWAKEDEEEGRLYLVPKSSHESKLKQSIRVAAIISEHRDELPDRHDVRYSIVTAEHPVIRAVRAAAPATGKLQGIYEQGTYIDTAYVFRPAA